jgi:polyvinyl alcohol dehydrogenase (cytochrome)
MAMAAAQSAAASDWPVFGQSVMNQASSPDESTISTANVATLAPKWSLTTTGYVSARAAVVAGVAYFPDSGGTLWAVNTATGSVIWSKSLTADYGFAAGTYSRTSPAVDNGTLFIGTQLGAYLLAIDTATGNLLWSTQMDQHPLAIITSSPVVSNGVIYGGVASLEEGVAANPNYPCCSFRGSAYAVSEATGGLIWKNNTVPAGYTGGAIWGSNAVIDTTRNLMYIGTGDNYSLPTDPKFTACVAAGKPEKGCLSPEDHFDSILALDLANGAIKWSHRLGAQDDWNVACEYGPPGGGNCPNPEGPDYDFGSAPQEFTYTDGGGVSHTIIGAGQKSGIYSAFDADTGKLMWAQQVGPGSSLGGIEWGSATDGQRLYVAISNLGHKHYANETKTSGTSGSWNALDLATGKLLWRTPDPEGAIDLGPMAVANGVVYAPSSASGSGQPNMFALNAATGGILWSFASGGSVIAGASISDGMVYWGSGYALGGLPIFSVNNKFYGFSLNGQ